MAKEPRRETERQRLGEREGERILRKKRFENPKGIEWRNPVSNGNKGGGKIKGREVKSAEWDSPPCHFSPAPSRGPAEVPGLVLPHIALEAALQQADDPGLAQHSQSGVKQPVRGQAAAPGERLLLYPT